MKLSIMREFVRLAAVRNYSRTAEELYMAQSALSRHMTSLEEELNVKLIDRSRNSFALTPMGEIALEGFRGKDSGSLSQEISESKAGASFLSAHAVGNRLIERKA